MEDNCTICKFIDMDKVKVKTDSSGKNHIGIGVKAKNNIFN